MPALPPRSSAAPPFVAALRGAGTRAPLAVALGLLALAMVPACKRRTPRPVAVPEMAHGFDASAIGADALDRDAAARHHVLNMSYAEMASRLPSLIVRSQSSISVGRRSEPLAQQAHQAMVAQDAAGSVHLQSGSLGHQLELFVLGDKAFVRHDRGLLRAKRRQEMDVAEMAEAAVSGLRQMLQHFEGVTLGEPAPATLDGHAAYRYSVQLGGEADALAVPQPALTMLPVVAPSRWREEAQNARLEGQLVVDKASGVVLRAEITGSFDVPGHETPAATVQLRVIHTVSEVGRVPTLAEPTGSVAEVRRPVRPHDPLSFFRAAQRAPAAPTPARAAAPAAGGDEALTPPADEDAGEEAP